MDAVVGDRLAEFGFDGGLLGAWSNFDMAPAFSPYVKGFAEAFDQGFWDGLYPQAVAQYGSTKDWTHANAASIDPADGNIVASSRTQSWIYKIARTGGGADAGGPKVLWRLGPGGDFKLSPAGDGFAYGQHGAYVTAAGTIMCLDDGYGRPVQGVTQPWSRAVEFQLDTGTMTASEAWQYREPGAGFYSQDFGSSYVLPNGDVLVDDGGELDERQGLMVDASNLKSARILEVTHTTPSTKVAEFDIHVPIGGLPADPSFSGFSVYRAQRFVSLYP